MEHNMENCRRQEEHVVSSSPSTAPLDLSFLNIHKAVFNVSFTQTKHILRRCKTCQDFGRRIFPILVSPSMAALASNLAVEKPKSKTTWKPVRCPRL
jgi:hypothetical protein